MSRLRENCKECGKPLVSQRSDAEFCDKRCSNKWHYKVRKESGQARPHSKSLTAVTRGPTGSRRASRDGKGTRIYLSEAEVVHLQRCHAYFGLVSPASKRLARKLRLAARRARGKVG